MVSVALQPISLFGQIWDVPGQIEMPVLDPEHMFQGCGALVFIIDAQVGRVPHCNQLTYIRGALLSDIYGEYS